MMKTNLKLNQSGFSLVNMVVGMGISLVVMAGFVSAMQVMSRAKQTVDVKQTASDFIDQMQMASIKPQNCVDSIGGQGINPLSTMNQGLNFAGKTQGMEIAKGVMIKTLQIKPTSPPLRAPGAQGEDFRSVAARIQVEIENTMVNPPQKLRGRFIPIQLIVDASNTIVSCGRADTQAQVCEELDGVWDTTAPAGLQCMPKDKCLYGGSFSDAPATGTDANGNPYPGFINTFTGGATCPAYFTKQSTGTVQVARKASKYKVVYDTYTNYTCVRCLGPISDQTTAMTTSDLDGTGEGELDAINAANQGGTNTINIGNICGMIGCP